MATQQRKHPPLPSNSTRSPLPPPLGITHPLSQLRNRTSRKAGNVGAVSMEGEETLCEAASRLRRWEGSNGVWRDGRRGGSTDYDDNDRTSGQEHHGIRLALQRRPRSLPPSPFSPPPLVLQPPLFLRPSTNPFSFPSSPPLFQCHQDLQRPRQPLKRFNANLVRRLCRRAGRRCRAVSSRFRCWAAEEVRVGTG